MTCSHMYIARKGPRGKGRVGPGRPHGDLELVGFGRVGTGVSVTARGDFGIRVPPRPFLRSRTTRLSLCFFIRIGYPGRPISNNLGVTLWRPAAGLLFFSAVAYP